MEGCAASSMARSHYVFVTCLATGDPWSEQPVGTSFGDFMTSTFGSSLDDGEPSQEQDMEFSCAHPTRNGSNSMSKGPSACNGFETQQTPRVVLSLRGLWMPAGRKDIIRSSDLSKPDPKFWLAVPSEQEVRISAELGNDRRSPYRRHPANIAGQFPPELFKTIKEAVEQTVEMALAPSDRSRTPPAKRPRFEDGGVWNCLKKLVAKVGIAEDIPDEQNSTAWKAAGDTVYAPWDIVRRKCTCARGVSFPEHLFKDCKGLGTSNVAFKTRFDSEPEVTAALLHAMKCKLLCELLAGSISNEDILRLKVHEDNLGFATVVCRLGSYMKDSVSWVQDNSNVFSTDKHRMLWLINLSSLGVEGNAQSAQSRDYRLTKSKESPDILELAYERGTLHVIKAAPKRDYSTRITVEPCLPVEGEYLGVILGWVGSRAYQHTAMLRSAAADDTLGLGVLRSAFFITQPWRGPSINCQNVLKGHVAPDSPFMKGVLKRRRIHLSADQEQCMWSINGSDKPHLKIQAFAGTGKSLLLSLLVDAALTLDCPKGCAVVIVTPSRNLRDAILQGPDFKNSVFKEDDLGPRVIWLGRPSDSVGALCSWEDRMWTLINDRLLPERTKLEELERLHLRPAFQQILGLKVPWSALPSGDRDVISIELFTALDNFRHHALMHMRSIFHIRRRRGELMDVVLSEPSQGHLIVSTMDAFVKWRAGETKGPINRILERLKVTLFCMEEYESFDVSQVVAALSNFHANTLLMVGDEHQRVENNFRRRAVNFNGEGSFGDLRIARYGLADDAEQYEVAQATSDIDSGSLTVPESRPWHEWCRDAEDGVLDRCKRCGEAVCDYVKNCFDFIKTYSSDSKVAYKTVLEHVFFDGKEWCCSPLRPGQEVGWHALLFEALCHIALADVQEYLTQHPGTHISGLPRPTVLVVMPLSRSAIPLCVLLQEACKQTGIPPGVVHVSLPLNIRGESVPIVHCVRHRRTLHVPDQYAGLQQNLKQEYINLTRGVEKTCMWLEEQPFGYPHRQCSPPDDVHVDARCARYAVRRNQHICSKRLMYYRLEDRGSIVQSYYRCFGKDIFERDAAWVSQLAWKAWEDLRWGKLKQLPNLGQGPSDFKCLDEVLSQAAGQGTDVSKFTYACTKTLRDAGHGKTAAKYQVGEIHDKVNSEIQIFDWKPAMQFGHLLLPCATAEISSQADRGLTRLCLPFLQVSDGLDPEKAITSLCCLTWYLAFRVEADLVARARLHRVPHKMRITKEDGDLWFNKACSSGRIATAIKENNKSVVYMYIGGGAVDHAQSYLLGGVVVSCKTWRWAAFVYAATRIVGQACNNSFGPLDPALVIPMDGEEGELTMATSDAFHTLCQHTWELVNAACCNDMLCDLTEERRFDLDRRQRQSETVGLQLARQKRDHEHEVDALRALPV